MVRLLPCALGTTLLAGCGAQRVNFKPTPAQKAMLAEQPLDYDVVVTDWAPGTHSGRNARAYARSLASLLTRSHAFRSVTYDSTGRTAAQLVARSTADYCNTALIPLYTILTLGLYPTIWNETQCDGVVFRRPGAPGGDSVVVRVKQSGTALLGWAALPLGLWPGWSWRELGGTSSYGNTLRLAILEKREDLARLVVR